MGFGQEAEPRGHCMAQAHPRSRFIVLGLYFSMAGALEECIAAWLLAVRPIVLGKRGLFFSCSLQE
jgi:hypothetical protein